MVYDDATVYCNDHSPHWQAAEQGQAFTTWMGELELLTDFDGAPTDEVRMAKELSGERPRADLDPTLTPARYMNGRMVDKIMTYGILA